MVAFAQGFSLKTVALVSSQVINNFSHDSQQSKKNERYRENSNDHLLPATATSSRCSCKYSVTDINV